jgi:hypothetical protein
VLGVGVLRGRKAGERREDGAEHGSEYGGYPNVHELTRKPNEVRDGRKQSRSAAVTGHEREAAGGKQESACGRAAVGQRKTSASRTGWRHCRGTQSGGGRRGRGG